jgi:hypothetical protein
MSNEAVAVLSPESAYDGSLRELDCFYYKQLVESWSQVSHKSVRSRS